MDAKHRFQDHEEHEVHADEGWLISYADLMTLLFGFFVILYSMSKVDQKKFDAMSESMSKQFEGKGATGVAPKAVSASTQMSKVMKEELLKAGLNANDVEIVDDGESLTISLRGRASFETGEADLLPAGEVFVRDVAMNLKTSTLPYSVQIEGHTDDAGIYSKIYPTNWELSAARAAGVARRMADYGVAQEKLVASGYGSSRPIKPNRANGVPIPENMSLNRRIAITVVFPKAPAPARSTASAPTAKAPGETATHAAPAGQTAPAAQAAPTAPAAQAPAPSAPAPHAATAPPARPVAAH